MAPLSHLTVASPAGILLLVVLFSGCGLSATGTNMQGKQLFDQGQYAQAIEMFQRSINADPRNADGYYNMAAAYYYLGKQQKNVAWSQQADQLYRQALSLDPDHVDAYRGLSALLMDEGRTQEAFQLVQNWRVQQPDNPEPVIELARLYRESGDSAAATQLLADALHIDGNHARALKAMGMMREESGEYDLALQNYTRSYEANNSQTDVAQKIASLQGATRTAQNTTPPVQTGQALPPGSNQFLPR